jgi:tetratricopeptide (TPR) repeat protein
MHIATFLKDIALHGKTGHLSFFRGDIQKHFYFQDGSLIFIKTNIKGERLGEILLDMGKISPATYDSIPGLIQPDSMLGETLVQEKFISRQDLYEGLVQQMTLVTLKTFPVFDAEIVFRERERFFEGGLQQKMSLVHLIARGAREMSVGAELREFLAARIPVRSGDQNVAILTGDERSILDLIDGEKDIGLLGASCPGGPDQLLKIVFLLFGLGLVELRDIPKSATGAAAPPAPGTDPEARIADAAELHAKIAGLEDFRILEVRSDASEDEIKKAYFRMARKFHPDLFGRHISAQDKVLVGAVFDGITKAYHNLLAKLGKAEKPAKAVSKAAPASQAKAKSTETLFRQAKTLYSTARYEEAIALLEEAVRAKDDKGDYYLLLAMAQSKIPSLRKKAERSFLNAIELEPWNPEALIGLGMLYKKEGLMARAKKQFERAVEADPEHVVARQELKAMKDSAKPEQQKGLKGFLSKDLFGSKKK